MGTTEQTRWMSVTLVSSVDASPDACLCGQDLDGHRGRFCPRCGLHLGIAHAA
jgi:hypothetical protein